MRLRLLATGRDYGPVFPPCEAMVKSFLPAFRILVAKELSRKGVSQTKSARLLGVTQAAVNQYLKKGERPAFERLSTFNLPREDAQLYSSLLAEDLMRSPVEATYSFYGLWRSLLSRGDGCIVHRQISPQLATCDMCMKIMGPLGYTQERSKLLADLSGAVRILESNPLFAKLMPNVYVNLVACTGDAKMISDVAGIPGRIVKIRGMVKASSPPEFGSSHHMASILLEANRIDPDITSCVNTKYDEKVGEALAKMKWTFMKTVPKKDLTHIDGDLVLAAVRATFSKRQKVEDALIDEGGPGLEPIIYIFARSPKEAASKAVALARAYVEIQ